MTITAAEEALGTKLATLETSDSGASEECWYTQRVDRVDPLVSYMIWNGKIVRIDIDESELGSAERSVPSISSDKGISIGSTESDIKRAYGSRVIVSPHPYGNGDENSHYFLVASRDKQHGLLFETLDSRVNTFRNGLLEAIKLIEGCS